MTYTIGVDIGGTKVAGGLVDEQGHVVRRCRRPTPSADPADCAKTIAAVITELQEGDDREQIEAVGIGAAGFIDVERAQVVFAPNLAWRDEPLRDHVAEAVDLPVVVENDANAAAWGEYRFGAGAAEADLVMVTVGTGIGGGIVLDGRLHRGRWGIGAEIGHFRVVPGGPLCGCGNRGCWEQYASGQALLRAARELAEAAPARLERLIELAGGDAADIDGPVITAAAREGDPAAVECLRDVGHWLGQGMADLAAILDPGCFVVGGGVSDARDLLLGPARDAFAHALSGRGHRPLAPIRLARLGAEAGLVGAADLARDRD
jgi:glucokinase